MTKERHWLDLIAVSDIISHDVTPVTLGPRDLAVFDTDEGVTVSMARCTHGGAIPLCGSCHRNVRERHLTRGARSPFSKSRLN